MNNSQRMPPSTSHISFQTTRATSPVPSKIVGRLLLLHALCFWFATITNHVNTWDYQDCIGLSNQRLSERSPSRLRKQSWRFEISLLFHCFSVRQSMPSGAIQTGQRVARKAKRTH